MRRITGGLLLLAVALPAEAQEQKKPVNFTGDIGLVSTAGNTHLTTLNIGDKLTAQLGNPGGLQQVGRDAGDPHLAGRRSNLAVDQPQQRRLAGSAGSHQEGQLPRAQGVALHSREEVADSKH